jgi:hypothetical protein
LHVRSAAIRIQKIFWSCIHRTPMAASLSTLTQFSCTFTCVLSFLHYGIDWCFL